LSVGCGGEVIIKPRGFEMCFEERKRRTVTKRLWGGTSSLGAKALKDLPPRVGSLLRGISERFWSEDLSEREGV
jgi:hypothetical protein